MYVTQIFHHAAPAIAQYYAASGVLVQLQVAAPASAGALPAISAAMLFCIPAEFLHKPSAVLVFRHTW